MQHVISSCSTFLPSTIRIFRLFQFYRADTKTVSNTRGDNSKSKKAKVVILVCYMSSRPVLHFYQIPAKYSKGYLSYRAETKSISKTKQRELTPKGRKPFFYAICHVIPTFVPSILKIFQRVFDLQSEHEINA